MSNWCCYGMKIKEKTALLLQGYIVQEFVTLQLIN